MDDVARRTLSGWSTNTCAFCAYHGRALTPRQMKQHECLGKNCDALVKHEHPFWEYREKSRAMRRERKERLERMYQDAIHA